MLQTAAIKSDGSASATNAKEKDAASNSIEASFSTYFSQMMAVMPAPPPPAPAPAAPTPERAAAPAQSQSSASQAGSQVNAGTQAATTTTTTTAAAAQAAPPPGGAQPQNAAPAAASTGTGAAQQQSATAAAAQAKPAAKGTAGSTGTQDGTAQAAGKPAPAAEPAAALPAPAAGDQTAAQAKAALDQAHPGNAIQVQVGDAAAQTTTKAPLSEYANQIQMDPQTDGSAQAGTAADAVPAVVQADAAAAQLALGDGLLPPQMAAQAAFLALPTAVQASAGSAGTSTSASLSGLAASSAAAGAAAMPGASGAVRVTPATASESALPTGQKSLLSQVEGTIRYLVKDQDQSAELQLHPESLGRVQINLKVEGTVVHAKLWASEASAVPVMQQHRSFLEASLKAQGLTLGSFDLQQGRREDQAAQSAPAPSPATTSAPAVSAAPETPATPSAAPVRSNRIEYVA